MLVLTDTGQTATPPPWNGRIVFVVPGGNGIASMNPDRDGRRVPPAGEGPRSHGALQQLVLQPRKPWRGIRTIRIETHAGRFGSGWVSWHEIEVYAPKRT